ncbi:hypothetical protein BS47DRAFT_289384 [Hydnum rufescens UP504]|uniref:Uncharacterized protein n=1 Tax=Hydnum rufescens UP504 TaxID=1448309 RepID=A0A9P6AKP9_9AGAM|nr:hypothetical protein BS47DRAFT_289384 [Hydnum rufescens UP504]
MRGLYSWDGRNSNCCFLRLCHFHNTVRRPTHSRRVPLIWLAILDPFLVLRECDSPTTSKTSCSPSGIPQNFAWVATPRYCVEAFANLVIALRCRYLI